MINECLDEEEPFGIVWMAAGGLRDVGCAANVTQLLERAEDGRMNILVQGTQAFRLVRRIDDLALPRGRHRVPRRRPRRGRRGARDPLALRRPGRARDRLAPQRGRPGRARRLRHGRDAGLRDGEQAGVARAALGVRAPGAGCASCSTRRSGGSTTPRRPPSRRARTARSSSSHHSAPAGVAAAAQLAVGPGHGLHAAEEQVGLLPAPDAVAALLQRDRAPRARCPARPPPRRPPRAVAGGPPPPGPRGPSSTTPRIVCRIADRIRFEPAEPSATSGSPSRSTTVGAIMLGTRAPAGCRWCPNGLRSSSPSMLLRCTPVPGTTTPEHDPLEQVTVAQLPSASSTAMWVVLPSRERTSPATLSSASAARKRSR